MRPKIDNAEGVNSKSSNIATFLDLPTRSTSMAEIGVDLEVMNRPRES